MHCTAYGCSNGVQNCKLSFFRFPKDPVRLVNFCFYNEFALFDVVCSFLGLSTIGVILNTDQN